VKGQHTDHTLAACVLDLSRRCGGYSYGSIVDLILRLSDRRGSQSRHPPGLAFYFLALVCVRFILKVIIVEFLRPLSATHHLAPDPSPHALRYAHSPLPRIGSCTRASRAARVCASTSSRSMEKGVRAAIICCPFQFHGVSTCKSPSTEVVQSSSLSTARRTEPRAHLYGTACDAFL